MPGPYATLGPSSDPVGLATLVLGGVALGVAFGWRRVGARAGAVSSRVIVGALALGAAALSLGYVAHFLRGGPRIIDATSYYLEGHALAQGHFAFPVALPSAAFRGRFSLYQDGALSVIFPPGYPLALAAGFVVGAPLVVGPVLGALLVFATYHVARDLFDDEAAARLAATCSLLSAALRYHTADTMAHGLSALLLIVTLGSALGAGRPRAVLAGLAAGWLMATRPLSGLVAIAIALAAVGRRRGDRAARLFGFALAVLPGVALLVTHQVAATGSFFASTQRTYYALADGPPGCFAWGLGQVGCHFEHGDVIQRDFPDGFGLAAAAKVTLMRLVLHATDLVNFAPLALLVPWVAYRHRRVPGVLWLAGTGLAIVVAYAFFYYPGSYPGAGARLLADALPLEHVLLGLALARLGVGRFLPALALLGFALHGVHAHVALRDRDGGRPMFEPAVLRKAGIERGLVFVDTDHAFALGHDPAILDPRHGILVARHHGDAHDAALFRAFGEPPTYRYSFSALTGHTSVAGYRPGADPFREEAEAEWPALGVAEGWAHPDFSPCLSGGRGLRLHAAPAADVRARARVAREPGAGPRSRLGGRPRCHARCVRGRPPSNRFGADRRLPPLRALRDPRAPGNAHPSEDPRRRRS